MDTCRWRRPCAGRGDGNSSGGGMVGQKGWGGAAGLGSDCQECLAGVVGLVCAVLGGAGTLWDYDPGFSH